MRLALSAVLLVLAVVLPPGAAAQWRAATHASPSVWTAAPVEPPGPLPGPRAVQGEREARHGAMLRGGLWGGLVGGLVGVGLGLAADDIPTAYYGTAVGAAAGMSYGVHQGNRQAGSLPLGVLASLGWSLALAAVALEPESVPLFLAAPLGSLVISMTVEERTARAR